MLMNRKQRRDLKYRHKPPVLPPHLIGHSAARTVGTVFMRRGGKITSTAPVRRDVKTQKSVDRANRLESMREALRKEAELLVAEAEKVKQAMMANKENK